MNKRSKIATALGSALVLAGVGTGAALATSTVASPVSAYTPITPKRICDTRSSGSDCAAGAVPANGSLTFNPGVPSGATGVTLNVTVVSPAKNGDIVVDPDGIGGATGTSSVNFQAPVNTANEVTTQLGADGGITIYNQSAGTVQLVVDLDGYYTPGSGAVYVPETYTFNFTTPTPSGEMYEPGNVVAGYYDSALSTVVPDGANYGLTNIPDPVITVVCPDGSAPINVYGASAPTPNQAGTSTDLGHLISINQGTLIFNDSNALNEPPIGFTVSPNTISPVTASENITLTYYALCG